MNILNEIIAKHIIVDSDTAYLIENLTLLKKYMTKDDKVLLLRVIDEKNLLIENSALVNYKNGFCDGVKMAVKIFVEEDDEI